MNDKQFEQIYNEAMEAGRKAANAHTPRPMIVGEAKDLFSNEMDTSKPMHYVASGVCGFAWISIKPGNSKFANFLKKKGYAKRDSYRGGVMIWVGDYGQSLEKKEKHAYAMADVFQKHGFKAYAESRMD